MKRTNPLSEYFGYGSKIRLRLGVKRPAEAELIDLWQSVRDRFIDNWITKHPGSRPFYWWRHDAPEPRRCTNGKHPFDDPKYQKHARRIEREHPEVEHKYFQTYFGEPAVVVPGWHEREYESQDDYLRRLGLMLPGEEELINARGGPEPVAWLR